MADNSILTPGYLDINDAPSNIPNEKYLLIDNYLSEYLTEGEKSVVRENLNVPSKDNVYTKDETDINLAKRIQTVILEYLNTEDPHGILPQVEEMITNMVKIDGSTPFTAPQSGVEPISDNHLTTKKFVNKLLKEHLKTDDPHNTLTEVNKILEKYIKSSDVYNKDKLYTKDEIDKLNKEFIKRDGTTSFKKPQLGIDPLLDSHLSTKRYVDLTVYKHLIDPDPHNFLSLLNSRLASYIKKKDVYDKTLTYSRTQLDNIINNIINQAIELSLSDYKDSINNKVESIRKENYIKLDGSIPFKNPLSGVDAINDSDLVTLKLLKELISDFIKEEDKECEWITSGPVETTVGHIEDNSEVPSKMTFQLVCDAIFYGKGISLDIPESITINEKVTITVCLHGSTASVLQVEVVLNGELIGIFEKELFDNGCVTLNSLPIIKDSEIIARVIYTNNVYLEEIKTIKCNMPIFIGMLPKWKFGHTISMDYLTQLSKEEPLANKFVSSDSNVKSITYKYFFQDSKLRHPFIVMPVNYPNLESMITKSLSFGIEAFESINMIPLTIEGIGDVIYKMYIYKLALASLNQEVTFNFKLNESVL